MPRRIGVGVRHHVPRSAQNDAIERGVSASQHTSALRFGSTSHLADQQHIGGAERNSSRGEPFVRAPTHPAGE